MKNLIIIIFLIFSYPGFSQILPSMHGVHDKKGLGGGSGSNTILVIAGGGGGEIYQISVHSGIDASISESGNAGYNGTSGGTGGGGGSSSRGGGGGGYLTDGGEDSRRVGTAGKSFANGGQGGTRDGSDNHTGDGGFGGGGASIRVNNSITDQGAGGGGGYSGGGGAGTNNRSHGGGGGSYNSGSNQVNTTHPNASNTGNGSVVITQGGTTWTFTSCGISGKDGPSQSDCNSSYSGGSLDGSVTVNNGIQQWTIPSNGTYTIKAFGAQGGTQTDFSHSTHGGGRGAIIEGDFSLSSGDVLKILVGQQPVNVKWLNGGGGGTFVIKN